MGVEPTFCAIDSVTGGASVDISNAKEKPAVAGGDGLGSSLFLKRK